MARALPKVEIWPQAIGAGHLFFPVQEEEGFTPSSCS